MCSNLLNSLLNHAFNEPDFIQNGVHFGRGEHISKCADSNDDIQVVCWKIDADELIELDQQENGIFYDEEAYIIKWKVCRKYLNGDTLTPHCSPSNLYFYWKGSKAQKGKSPLPPEIKDDEPVERICQWSEPTVFLRIFSGKMIVHSGKRGDSRSPQLYILCGEFIEEMRIYAVPCKRESLRSNACFLLIDVEKNRMTIWHGNESLENQKKHIHTIANKLIPSSNSAMIKETIDEGYETDYFLNIVQGSSEDYNFHPKNTAFIERTPRLFYFHKLTGTLDFIEIEDIYRSKKYITHFPFLQSHLYSVAKPALFLLDASYKVWLWITSLSCDQEEPDFASDFETVKRLANEYSKKMGYTSTIEVAIAGQEPCEFTNLFPYWER